MVTISDRISDKLKSVEVWLKHISNDSQNLKPMSLNFRFLEVDFAVQSISEFDYSKAKQHLYNASLLDELRIIKFNDDLFSFGLPYVCYPILSDNEELIKRYSKLRYLPWGKMKGMDDNVLLGKSDIWCSTVQFFMANDVDGIERNLDILERLTLPKLKNKDIGLKDDYEFYKALHSKNKSKMEEVLEKLVSPKIHKKRNINNVHAQYISLPALGYAKLAWRMGVEVEVDSPLVPKELLPICQLDNYEVSYDFLNK